MEGVICAKSGVSGAIWAIKVNKARSEYLPSYEIYGKIAQFLHLKAYLEKEMSMCTMPIAHLYYSVQCFSHSNKKNNSTPLTTNHLYASPKH